MKVYVLLVLALFGCTKPNPAVCCLDPADCNEVGLGEVRDCNPGLACVEHLCEIPSCSMTGCGAASPVCNITTDVCEGCTDSSQCSKFTDTDVCETAAGSCVECVTASDCTAALPVCDANACRVCKVDAECPSGACGDDGACVEDSAIVFMDPAGADTGICGRSAPCRSFAFAIAKTSSIRPHVVLAPGSYVEYGILIDEASTTARPLYVHGGGASVSLPQGLEGAIFESKIESVIRHLEFFNEGGNGVQLGGTAPIIAEDIKVHGGYRGFSTGAGVTLRDVAIDGALYGIEVSIGPLTLERAIVHGGLNGVTAGPNQIVNLTNVLIYGTSDRALELPQASGTIEFVTVAYAGADTGTGPRAVFCSSNITMRSSIVWAPGTTSRVPIAGCNAVTSIAGPTTAAGFMNANPMFVAPLSDNFHLDTSSPARDAVDTGPATDFEGDARPQGARFDIGADEAK